MIALEASRGAAGLILAGAGSNTPQPSRVGLFYLNRRSPHGEGDGVRGRLTDVASG